MDKSKVDDLLKKLQEDWPIVDIVSFNEFNIQTKLQEQPYQAMRFNEQLIKERARLDELNDLKNRIVGKKYDELRFNSDKALTTKEIEQYYLPKDIDIRKVNTAITRQNIIIEYFELCVKSLNNMQWSIKLWIQDRQYSG